MSCKDLLQTNTPTSSNHASFPCAAKCLYADTDSQALGLAEANILRRLHTHKALHPGRQHLVDYFGLYERSAKRGISPFDNTQQLLAPQNDQDESWVLLLEYCHNGTIWDWIRQYPDRVGHRQWLAWAIQLLQATTCIHEAGLIHHDIKPHNILLDSALDAKLSDFGAGIFLNPESAPEDARSQLSLEEGRGRGTLPYAAPEMFASSSGNASYNQAIDIYSLGVSLYVIGLTAQEPFHKLKSVMEMIEHLVRKHMVPRASTYSAPNLPPINTQLPFDRGLLSPSSACSTNSPMALAPGANANANHSVPPGYSPEKPTRLSQPATPVSPLPLPSPILRSQTPRSAARKEEQQQRKSGEIVMRFLNGEVVPSEIVLLLKEMCHPVPEQRPLASTVLQRLLAMQDQLDSDMDKDMDIDDVDISMV
ncbi:hypothetical protein BGX31_006274 [Mortierella sp. GBA43]|nr:hypothetical protein BGX31_006274 [Mortierella sp. GBA43]